MVLPALKISFTDLLVQLAYRGMLLSTIVHEYGHLIALRLIGEDGYIMASTLNGVYPVNTITGTDAIIFYGGGGVFQALIFLFMAYQNRDSENWIINLFVATQGLIYGCFEALAPRAFWNMGAFLGMMAGTGLLVAIILWKKTEVHP